LSFIGEIWAKTDMAPPDESNDREQLPFQQRTQPMSVAQKSKIAVLDDYHELLL
jgi:hypothetical protein